MRHRDNGDSNEVCNLRTANAAMTARTLAGCDVSWFKPIDAWWGWVGKKKEASPRCVARIISRLLTVRTLSQFHFERAISRGPVCAGPSVST